MSADRTGGSSRQSSSEQSSLADPATPSSAGPPAQSSERHAFAVDESVVQRIAVLARIRVPEEVRQELAAELGKILSWVEQLHEVPVDGVEPMVNSLATNTLPMRPDTPVDDAEQEEILANAPERQGAFFSVPKFVE